MDYDGFNQHEGKSSSNSYNSANDHNMQNNNNCITIYIFNLIL